MSWFIKKMTENKVQEGCSSNQMSFTIFRL